MVSRRSEPATPASTRCWLPGTGWLLASRWARICLGLPARMLLVVLLDTVLAHALTVDEAHQVGGQGGRRDAARLGVDAIRLRLDRQLLELAARDSPPDEIGRVLVEIARQDDIRSVGGDPSQERRRVHVVETEHPRQQVAHFGPPCRGHLIGRCGHPVAIDRRSQQHGAGPVVDRAATGRDHLTERCLVAGLCGQDLAVEELPLAEPDDEAAGRHAQDDKQHDEAVPQIGPAEHRSSTA